MTNLNHHIKNESLSKIGEEKVGWAERQMPVLRTIKADFKKRKPLKNKKIAACLHITSETANLVEVLIAGGAKVRICASNPLSTQDEVAAYLYRKLGVEIFAIRGENNKTYYRHINLALDHLPDLTIDDGADLIGTVHQNRREILKGLIGGTEETTTGVIRLKAMAKSGSLEYPVVAVNEAKTKHFFDNRYGTGQSTIDGILRSTNLLLAGSRFTVCGYGWCGRGIATRARGMGALVTVCEVDPLRALEAKMDGYEVMPLREAVKSADLIVTATGSCSVVSTDHFRVIKDGAILANSGHFNVEIDLKNLEKIAVSRKKIRGEITEYRMNDGRKIFVLAEGRLVNLAAAEGHPSAVMDMSFANQSLSIEFLVNNSGKLSNRVYDVPEEIDNRVAYLKLGAMGIGIDQLTREQKRYLSSWREGT